jgi:multidrug efflux pump subunit AcrA (membrane-fusion protein)
LTLWGRARSIALALLACTGAALVTWAGLSRPPVGAAQTAVAPDRGSSGAFYPTPAQWASLTVEPVRQIVFRPVYVTEGKIAVNEDQATPIYSPYAGRVMRLLAKPGDRVVRGQPLFILEATDAVQVHNDFIAAITALNKANAQLRLAQTVERRLGALYEGKAIALKDWQQAQADLVNAQNDASALTAQEIHQQAGKAHDFDVGMPGQRIFGHLHPFLQTEERALRGTVGNREHDVIEQAGSTQDEVFMATRDGIESPRVDGFLVHWASASSS